MCSTAVTERPGLASPAESGNAPNADYELNVDGRLRTALAAQISPFCAPGPTGVEVVIRLAGNHMIDPLRPLLQRAPGKGQQPRW